MTATAPTATRAAAVPPLGGALSAAEIAGVPGRIVLVDGGREAAFERAARGWTVSLTGTPAAPTLILRAAAGPCEALHVVLATTGASAGIARPQIIVEAAERSEAAMVETHMGLASSPVTIESATRLRISPSAILRHVRVQRQGIHATHAARTDADVGRAGRLDSFTFALGAQRAREELHVRLDEGSEATVDGLFLGTADQVLDQETRVHHDKPRATSRQLWKGILDGASHGGFLGFVEVAKDAIKTNAEQTNRNLLLSDKATVDTTPQLEIHNDDVKCSHGSTIGRLDDQAIFFLRSRGLGLPQARQLLTQAFAREALARIGHEGIRAHLDGLVTAWFAGRNDAERVL